VQGRLEAKCGLFDQVIDHVIVLSQVLEELGHADCVRLDEEPEEHSQYEFVLL
jgi:hypothetical protein